jgi:ABC-type nitrate/sulfonate/bicarbonate transport system permease component
LGGVFPILVNTQAGVQNTNPRLIETARAFTASELQIFGEIMLPSAVPFIIAGIRLAIGRILIMVFVAEFYASTQGVGFLIMNAGAHYKTSLLFVGVLIFTFTGVAFSEILRIVELKMLARYQEQ